MPVVGTVDSVDIVGYLGLRNYGTPTYRNLVSATVIGIGNRKYSRLRFPIEVVQIDKESKRLYRLTSGISNFDPLCSSLLDDIHVAFLLQWFEDVGVQQTVFPLPSHVPVHEPESVLFAEVD